MPLALRLLRGAAASGARVLDFATLTPAALASRFGWTRTGAGTMIDSGGLARYGAHNLLARSGDLANAAWGSSFTSGGTRTGDTFAVTGSNAFGYFGQAIAALTVGQVYTASFKVTSSHTRSNVGVRITGGSDVGQALIDVTAGVPRLVVLSLVVTGSITTIYPAAIDTRSSVIPGAADMTGVTFTISEPSFVLGPVALDYVPTTTAPVFLMRTPDSTFGVPGLLLEGQRTQLLQCDLGAQLATQTKTVTAVAHTFSFYGTGSVVLSGSHSATVTGTGATVLTHLTFTPSAGSLTLTVSGTVTNGLLEVGSYPTSRIPNPGTGTVTRAADFAVISGTAFSEWFNTSEGTFVIDCTPASNTGTTVLSLDDGNGGYDEYMSVYWNSGSLAYVYYAANTLRFSTFSGGSIVANTRARIAVSYSNGSYAVSLNGGTPVSGGSGAASALLSRLRVFGDTATSVQNDGVLHSLTFHRTAFFGAALQALTA